MAWFCGVALALVLSRWLLFPRYLVTFDEINFAYSIRDFNPLLHQPQPPGYPLFVALLKLLSLALPNVESVFLIAGLLLSGASLILIRQLAELAAGPKWGLAGALLLLFNPAFWLSALTNPVRLSLAFGSLLVALCVWKAWTKPDPWFPLATGALGFACGFQPTLAVLMAPLLLTAAIRRRLHYRLIAQVIVCGGAGAALWLPPLLYVSGGWRQYWNALCGYSDAQFTNSSLLFGAPLSAALQMAWNALVWSSLGVLSWVWILPFVSYKLQPQRDRFRTVFLALWFVPGLLFYGIYHVGDPDHTLSIVPATCVAGAMALAALARRTSRQNVAIALAVCVTLNVFLFFKPISKSARASTYKPVHWMNGHIAHVIDGFRRVQRDGRAAAMFYEPAGEWRHLSYYEPHADLILLGENGNGSTSVRRVRGSQVLLRKTLQPNEPLQICDSLILVNPRMRPSKPSLIAWESPYPRVLFVRPAVPTGCRTRP